MSPRTPRGFISAPARRGRAILAAIGSCFLASLCLGHAQNFTPTIIQSSRHPSRAAARIPSPTFAVRRVLSLICGAGADHREPGEIPMAVIAISQQVGSRGIELGRLTAEQLGWRFKTGQELIAEAARRFGVSEDQLLVFDLRTPHFWERLRSESHRYLAYIRAVLLKELSHDSIVVAGRALGHLTPPLRYALRVRVVSPVAERIKCTEQEERLSATGAEKHVREIDRETKARSQSLSGIDVDDPTIYVLIVNS